MHDSPQIPVVDSTYRAMFELHPHPMLVVNIVTGLILEANETTEYQYGRSRENLVGFALKEFWVSDFPEPALDADPEKLCHSLNGRWVHWRKNQKKFHADVSCRLLDPSGTLAMVVVEDISRRRRAAKFDAAISKLGQKLSEATTPRSAGRVIADISRDLIGWDACSITLYSPETNGLVPVFAVDTIDGVPTELPETLPPGTAPSPVFREILDGGSRLILRDEGGFSKTSIPFGDTSRRSESLIFVPVRKGDRAVGVLSIQSYRKGAYSRRDVKTLEGLATHCAGALERLQVASALRIAEQRFALAFESSPVAMYIGTREEGRALAVNAAFVQIFGFSREELLGKNGLELGFWADPNDRKEVYEAIGSGRKVRDVQVRFRTKGGQLRHVLVSIEAIEVEGEESLLFFNYDITERVNLESRLRQSQKLESIGQVTAGVAHDFNNILTVIDGCSSLAQENAHLDNRSRDLLKQISLAAERAGRLTRQLLAFSSRQKMVLQGVDANRLLGELSRMLQQLLGPQISLQLTCAPELPCISADSGMIEQVVVNMVVNARDSMAEGGELRIETSVVERKEALPENPAGDFVCIQVSDTGCGISPGNLSRLFEPFFTTKEVGKGSGLGLATSYGIVKQHGGWIDVSSRIGEGTVFRVYLPAWDGVAPESAAAGTLSAGVARGKESILVVEDEPAVRDLTCHILQFYGYKTLEADSGAGGLAVWKEFSDEIDGVVTDIVMPGGMDGREMARAMLEDRPKLPILYVSGYSPAITSQDGSFEDGVNFLQKPFKAAVLAQTLRSCLDRSKV